MGDQIIGKILNELLLTGDGAAIEQITDKRGKRLFKPGTMEVDADPATGMLKMVPWYSSDKGGPSQAMFFLLGNVGGELNINVRSDGRGYKLAVAGSRSAVTVAARGGKAGVDTFILRRPGTVEPSLSLRNTRNADGYDVEFRQIVRPRQEVRTFRSTGIIAPAAATVEFGITKNQTALVVASKGGSARYDLQLRRLTKVGETVADMPGVKVDAERTSRTQPKNWQNLKSKELLDERIIPRVIRGTI